MRRRQETLDNKDRIENRFLPLLFDAIVTFFFVISLKQNNKASGDYEGETKKASAQMRDVKAKKAKKRLKRPEYSHVIDCPVIDLGHSSQSQLLDCTQRNEMRIYHIGQAQARGSFPLFKLRI